MWAVQILQAQFPLTEVAGRKKVLETSGNAALRRRRRAFDVALFLSLNPRENKEVKCCRNLPVISRSWGLQFQVCSPGFSARFQ